VNMKGLRWHGDRDIRYEEIQEPSAGPGQLKVKIHLAGICGSDVERYDHGSTMVGVTKVPITLGHEFAGSVIEVGKDVTDFKVGDRVTGIPHWHCGHCYFCQRGFYNLCLSPDAIGLTKEGCMAEYFVAPAYTFYKLPESVPDEIGALVEPLSVGIHAVRQGGVCFGDSVAIVGAGTIGLCTLLAARAAGASVVYIVDRIKSRGKIALAMGANTVIYSSEKDPVQTIGNLTGGLGTDIAFECAGQPDTLQIAVNLARRGGTVVIVGHFDTPFPFNFGSMTFSEKTLVGSLTCVHEAKAAIAILADGRIDASSLITSKVPLKDAVKLGFETILTNKGDNIKILLQIS
jgi:(R,R)-butanediol dehydrogenase / meso-butanediol dehydrogenase / diacetyl reductase